MKPYLIPRAYLILYIKCYKSVTQIGRYARIQIDTLASYAGDTARPCTDAHAVSLSGRPEIDRR